MIKKTLSDVGVQTLSKLLGSVLGLLSVRVLASKLGLESYGLYILLSGTYLIWDILADFGSKTIGVREVVASKNRLKTLSNILALRIVMTVVALVLGFVFVFTNQFLVEYRSLAIFALGMVLLTSFAGYFEMLCQERARLGLKSLVDAMFSVAFFVWIYSSEQIDLWSIYGALMIFRAISLGFGYFVLGWTYKRGVEIQKEVVVKMFWMCLPVAIHQLIFMAYDRTVDTWILSFFWGKETVATYGIAYKMYSNLVMPAYFFMNSIFPRLSAVSESHEMGSKIAVKSAPWLISMSLCVIVVTWVLSPILAEYLLPSRSGEVSIYIRYLSLALFFSYINHLLGFLLLSRQGQIKLLYIGVASLVLNIVLNLLFIPQYGATGASFVTVFTEMSMTLCLLVIFLKK